MRRAIKDDEEKKYTDRKCLLLKVSDECTMWSSLQL